MTTDDNGTDTGRVGDLVAVARRARQVQALAQAAGVSRMTLSRWARGVSAPDDGAAGRLAAWAASFCGSSPERAAAWLRGGDCPRLAAAAAVARAEGAVKALREALGLTQEAAADAAGVSRATWISWEQRDAEGRLPAARRDRAIAALRETFPDGEKKI